MQSVLIQLAGKGPATAEGVWYNIEFGVLLLYRNEARTDSEYTKLNCIWYLYLALFVRFCDQSCHPARIPAQG